MFNEPVDEERRMNKSLLLTLAAGFLSAAAHATGYLETPRPRSFQSGIGVVSGWHCTAKSIQVRIDDSLPLEAGTRTERKDTIAVCGHSDTGFSLLVNFNALDPAVPHRLVAYADGLEFARVDEFHARNLGAEFLTGRQSLVPVLNFPSVGERTWLTWSEEAQNFSIAGREPAAPLSGVYYGAEFVVDFPSCSSAPSQTSRKAQFTVAVAGDRLTLESLLDDGTRCTLSAVGRLESDGYFWTLADETTASSCTFYRGDFRLRVNGERLAGNDTDGVCRMHRVVGAK